ncbi:MAG TPA: hypothetical protein VHE82_13680 [Gemmatimonadaceae bacterium]|nr:hypothetical protein [Gemmatimonadaceae bacterium]
MAAGLVSPELVRAWELYFRSRGGETPNVPSDILPVVILDDNSRGPYPPYRTWVASRTQGPVIAQWPQIGIVNLDVNSQKSVVVIDEISLRASATDNFAVLLTTLAILNLATPVPVSDCAMEKDQAATNQPKLGNVESRMLSNAGDMGGDIYPGGSLSVITIRGPWTIGPGGLFAVQTAAQNETLSAFFRGRYYPSV